MPGNVCLQPPGGILRNTLRNLLKRYIILYIMGIYEQHVILSLIWEITKTGMHLNEKQISPRRTFFFSLNCAFSFIVITFPSLFNTHMQDLVYS
jgi:hypothetical protein